MRTFTLYLIDADRHLLHKEALLLSLTDQAGEEAKTVIIGPGGAGRGLWGNIRRGGSRPVEHRQGQLMYL